MSPMHHYLHNKYNIILSKTDRLTMFSVQVSVWQQSILKVTSSVILACSGVFGWHDIFL